MPINGSQQKGPLVYKETRGDRIWRGLPVKLVPTSSLAITIGTVDNNLSPANFERDLHL